MSIGYAVTQNTVVTSPYMENDCLSLSELGCSGDQCAFQTQFESTGMKMLSLRFNRATFDRQSVIGQFHIPPATKASRNSFVTLLLCGARDLCKINQGWVIRFKMLIFIISVHVIHSFTGS